MDKNWEIWGSTRTVELWIICKEMVWVAWLTNDSAKRLCVQSKQERSQNWTLWHTTFQSGWSWCVTNKNRLSAKTEIGGKPVQNRSRTAKVKCLMPNQPRGTNWRRDAKRYRQVWNAGSISVWKRLKLVNPTIATLFQLDMLMFTHKCCCIHLSPHTIGSTWRKHVMAEVLQL